MQEQEQESVIKKMRIETQEALARKTLQYWIVQRNWQGNAPPELGKPLTVAKAITTCNNVLRDLNPNSKLSIRTFQLLDAIINKPEKAKASG
jgi:hypothetical protein